MSDHREHEPVMSLKERVVLQIIQLLLRLVKLNPKLIGAQNEIELPVEKETPSTENFTGFKLQLNEAAKIASVTFQGDTKIIQFKSTQDLKIFVDLINADGSVDLPRDYSWLNLLDCLDRSGLSSWLEFDYWWHCQILLQPHQFAIQHVIKKAKLHNKTGQIAEENQEFRPSATYQLHLPGSKGYLQLLWGNRGEHKLIHSSGKEIDFKQVLTKQILGNFISFLAHGKNIGAKELLPYDGFYFVDITMPTFRFGDLVYQPRDLFDNDDNKAKKYDRYLKGKFGFGIAGIPQALKNSLDEINQLFANLGADQKFEVTGLKELPTENQSFKEVRKLLKAMTITLVSTKVQNDD